MNIAVEFTVLLRGRLGLDGSTSVSPRMMVGSERGKELNGSLRTSGGSVNSIGPGLSNLASYVARICYSQAVFLPPPSRLPFAASIFAADTVSGGLLAAQFSLI